MARRVHLHIHRAGDAEFKESEHPRDDGGKFSASAAHHAILARHHGNAARSNQDLSAHEGSKENWKAERHEEAKSMHHLASMEFGKAAEHQAAGRAEHATAHATEGQRMGAKAQEHETLHGLPTPKPSPREIKSQMARTAAARAALGPELHKAALNYATAGKTKPDTAAPGSKEEAANITRGIQEQSDLEDQAKAKFPVGSYVRANVAGSKPERVTGHSGNMIETEHGQIHQTKAVAHKTTVEQATNPDHAELARRHGKTAEYHKGEAAKNTKRASESHGGDVVHYQNKAGAHNDASAAHIVALQARMLAHLSADPAYAKNSEAKSDAAEAASRKANGVVASTGIVTPQVPTKPSAASHHSGGHVGGHETDNSTGERIDMSSGAAMRRPRR